MDWFSWLSKAHLDPSLVYEYGLAFTQNELDQEDISFFNHEFLQSIGISIAKHRLEILKLAKKETGRDPHHMSKFLTMITKTRKCIAKYIHAWLHRDESALMVLPGKAHGTRWRGAMLRKNKSLVLLKQERLMLTDESLMATPSVASGASPLDFRKNGEVNAESCWSTGVEEEIRWASMFQDLKPN